MSKLARLLARQFRWTFVWFGVCVVALASVSVWSLSIATGASDSLSHDRLRTLQATTSASDAIREAYERATSALAPSDPTTRRADVAAAWNVGVRNADVELAALQGLITIDSSTERTSVARLAASWRAMRSVLVPILASTTPNPSLVRKLHDAFAGVDPAVSRLRTEEQAASVRDAADASDALRHSLILILTTGGVALLAFAFLVLGSSRRLIEGAVADETAQQEFAQTMQYAETEDDAYHLITRHLVRSLPDARALVLNRNNSADRLEAMTEIPTDWDLASHLDGATPRSCLAIRTAQTHQRDPMTTPLLACNICGECPRSTLCTPITVAGEIIGTVLMEGSNELANEDATVGVQRTVAEGAPVLANLRNLAIAELRASTDALTGLPNKRALAHTLKRMVAQAARTVTPLTVLALDLDHFKQINDQYGHPRGDEVLAAVGMVLRSTVREADVAGRNGGEEFLVLLPATTSEGAVVIATKLASAIRQIYVRDIDRTITVSIGIATLPDHAGDPDRLERAADRALYAAKTNGRDRIEIATSRSEPPNGSKPAATPDETVAASSAGAVSRRT